MFSWSIPSRRRTQSGATNLQGSSTPKSTAATPEVFGDIQPAEHPSVWRGTHSFLKSGICPHVGKMTWQAAQVFPCLSQPGSPSGQTRSLRQEAIASSARRVIASSAFRSRSASLVSSGVSRIAARTPPVPSPHASAPAPVTPCRCRAPSSRTALFGWPLRRMLLAPIDQGVPCTARKPSSAIAAGDTAARWRSIPARCVRPP